MTIPNDTRFMYWGRTPEEAEQMSFGVPFPSFDSGAFEAQYFVDSNRSAAGVVVGQMVGRVNVKQNISWAVLAAPDWWRINNYIDQTGPFFYARMFNHMYGRWETLGVYIGDRSCDPNMIDAGTGEPAFYTNCVLNVIDRGEH